MRRLNNSPVAQAVTRILRKSPGALGFMLLVASSGAAHAQTQPAEAKSGDTIDEVIVTGYRASLATAVEEKRESNQILESITAEDIGKLPDNSIAESLGRVPGLTTQRLDGRSQVISIRGLAPDFSTTLLNGREQVSTGDNRSAEYDQYPAEVMNAVVIYKTPNAALVGQGLSGTVDMRTVRPLGYGKRVIAGNIRGETLSLDKLNAGSDDTGFRVGGTYIDQFADDTIGVSVGVAYMESPTQIEKFNAWGYPTIGDGSVRALGGMKPYVSSSLLKRTGIVATLEFQPTQNFNTAVDLYYSKFKNDEVQRGVEFPLIWGGVPLQPGYVTTKGIATQGTYDGVKGVVRNDANRRDADLWSVGWNGKLNLDQWTLVGDAAYSKVERKDIILETYSGTGRRGVGATDTLGFTITEPGRVRLNSTLNYADPGLIMLTSPQGWGDGAVGGGQDGFINSPNITDKLTSLRFGVSRELGSLFKSVDVGVTYSMRDKDYAPDRYYLGLKANADDPEHDLSVPIPASALKGTTRLGFLNIPGMVSYDPITLAYSGIYNFNPARDADAFSRYWKVGEDVLTGYAMLNIDAAVGESALTGNVGVQFVNTDQTSDGTNAVNPPAGSPTGTPATAMPISIKQRYTETLPSLNLSLRMPNEMIARLGLARQFARPRLDDMKASINYGYDRTFAESTNVEQSPWNGSGGNPKLRPWIADAADLSLEKYFGREAYISGAVFYKKLKTYIYNQSVLHDFTGFMVPGGDEPVLRQGYVTSPQNGKGGKIYGYELAGTLPFGALAPALDGFGINASYSYTKSNIQPEPGNPARPIAGLSQDVASATLYFEKYGFSARVSGRYRSKFIAEVQGIGADRQLRMAQGETLLDAQVSYEFQSGALQGMSVLLQGANLTDEPFVTTEILDKQQVIDYQSFGRRYLLGVSYKY